MVLKNVLLINAISSGLTGLLIALSPKVVASILKVNNTATIIGTGAFLVVFSLFVLVTAFKHLETRRGLNLLLELI